MTHEWTTIAYLSVRAIAQICDHCGLNREIFEIHTENDTVPSHCSVLYYYDIQSDFPINEPGKDELATLVPPVSCAEVKFRCLML